MGYGLWIMGHGGYGGSFYHSSSVYSSDGSSENCYQENAMPSFRNDQEDLYCLLPHRESGKRSRRRALDVVKLVGFPHQ